MGSCPTQPLMRFDFRARHASCLSWTLTLLVLLGPLITSPVAASPAYEQTLRISPPTPVADLQVRVRLSPDRFNYSLAQPDGADIRFTSTAGTPLAYWIERWNPAGESTLWIRVPDAATERVRMTYGDPSAPPQSNGAATFELFDDFESLAAWLPLTQSAGTASTDVLDGRSVAVLSSPNAYNGSALTRAFSGSGPPGAGYVLEARIRRISSEAEGVLIAFTDGTLEPTYADLPMNGHIGYLFRHGNQFSGVIRMVNRGGYGSAEASTPDSGVAGEWYVAGLRWFGGAFQAERNRAALGTPLTEWFTSLSHVHLSNLVSTWAWDWVLVRKATSVDSLATIDVLAEYRAEGTGADSAGGHPATLNEGVSFTEGVAGRAFALDGNTGQLSVPAFPWPDEWSFETWVRADACSQGDICPILTRSAGDADGLVLAHLAEPAGPHGRFCLSVGDGAAWQVRLSSSKQYARGLWHHVVVTKAGPVWSLFVNGELAATQHAIGTADTFLSRDLKLGGWSSGAGALVTRGALDEVRVLASALSPDTISARYRSGLPHIALPWRDEFNGQLRPAWRRTREASELLSFSTNGLRLLTSATDLWGPTNNLLNLSTVRLANAPDNYVITAQIAAPAALSEEWQQAGIGLFADVQDTPDPDNYVRQMHVLESGARFEITYDIDGVPNPDLPNGPLVSLPAGAPYWLRFVRANGRLVAAYSLDGTQFTPFSRSTTRSFSTNQSKALPHVGLFALHGWRPATPLAFDFRYLEIAPFCSGFPRGLIGWWSGDAGHDDALGNNPATAVASVSLAPGRVGQGFSVGRASRLAVLSPRMLPIGPAPRTVSLWFRTSSEFEANPGWTLFDYGSTATGGRFLLSVTNTQPPRLRFSGEGMELIGSTPLASDSWHHVAVTFDGHTVRLHLLTFR